MNQDGSTSQPSSIPTTARMPEQINADSTENKTAMTNVVVAFLEVISSFLRLKHTGIAISQCLHATSVAIENPIIIKALQRILQTAAAACEKETVMESIAKSLEATSNKLKQESVTIESFVQVVLNWSTHLLTWLNSFLEKEQLSAIVDTFGPVMTTAKKVIDYSMSYPLVSYLVNQVQTQARSHLSPQRLYSMVQRSQNALLKAQSLSSSAWSYVYPQEVDIARQDVHRHLLKRSSHTFTQNALEVMLETHIDVQRALLQLAMEQSLKIRELEKSLAETNLYAAELGEAIARGPQHKHTTSNTADTERIRKLEADLEATTAFANELAEAIARGPRKDPIDSVVFSECFGLNDVPPADDKRIH